MADTFEKNGDDKVRPLTRKQFGTIVTKSTSGFVYLTNDNSERYTRPLAKLERKRGELLKLLYTIALCVDADIEFTVLPIYALLPTMDFVIKIDPKDCKGEGSLMVAATERIAEFVSTVKSDPELLVTWLKAEERASEEASALPLVIKYGLSGKDSKAYNRASGAVGAAIEAYHKETKGSKDPDVIIRARKKRDDALLAAIEDCQHLAVLFMNFSMLPSAYVRRHRLSDIKGRKAQMEKKEYLLEEFRASCIDAYHKGDTAGPTSGFNYNAWLSGFIKGFSSSPVS
jgi:hypothetical protein